MSHNGFVKLFTRFTHRFALRRQREVTSPKVTSPKGDLPVRHAAWGRSPLSRWLHRPVVWWVVVVGLAVSTTALVLSLAEQAADRERAWGETRSVAVVVRPIDIGQSLVDATVWRSHPEAVVAAGAVRSLDGDQIARAPMQVGDVVLDQDVMVGASSLGHRLPAGTSAVTLPAGAGWPELRVGDRVDLIATFGLADTTGVGPETQYVSHGAVVVDLGGAEVTIAVPQSEVTTVAHALARAVILAVLVPGVGAAPG